MSLSPAPRDSSGLPAGDPDVPDSPSESVEVDEARAGRSLRTGLISLALLMVLMVGLLLAVPGLHHVGHDVSHMNAGWLIAAVLCEVLSCLSYVVAFLRVFDRAPVRFGARVALSELAIGAAVSFGGASSIAAGGLLLVERGAPPGRVAERSAVLFLLTSAVNVLTLGLAGMGLWLGILPGKNDILLSLVPGIVGFGLFFGFLALAPIVDRFVPVPAQASPSTSAAKWRRRIAIALRSTAGVVRSTARILFRPDWRIIGSIGFLWFDIAVLWVCFAAIGPVPPLAVVILAYQIGYLSNLIPIPGGIGVLDGSFVGMFVLYGVNATTATAATVAYHAVSLWVPLMWGTVAFLLLRRTRGQPLVPREPRQSRRERRRERASD